MPMGYSVDKEIILVLGIPIYLTVVGIIIFLKRRRGKRIDIFMELAKFSFAVFIMVLIGVTLFPIEIYFGEQARTNYGIVINYIPFISIVEDVSRIGDGFFSVGFQIKLLVRNVGGNFILLMPIGFLVPILWQKAKSIKYILIVGLAVSLSIELLQLLELYLNIGFARVVDVDDLILNVLGAVFGYAIYNLVNLVIAKYKIKQTKVSNII
jgi:glycopeptide antibiotics resistance protein